MSGSFRYSIAAGTVLHAGAGQTLAVTFTPSDPGNYNSVTTTTALTVLKATPVVTWAAPADIADGTALGAAQLNATASIPGTFRYQPLAGTVLHAGAAQTLVVTFTPANSSDFNSVTTSVSINVVAPASHRRARRSPPAARPAGRGPATNPASSRPPLPAARVPDRPSGGGTSRLEPGGHLGVDRGPRLRHPWAAQLAATTSVAGSFHYSEASGRCSTPERARSSG